MSGEYDTLLPTDELDAAFLQHLPHSIYFQQTCFHSSIGVHVEKLIFKLEDWLKWPFYVPPVAEQRRIAEVLSTWDSAIVAAERLVSQLATLERRRLETLSIGWDRRPLANFGRLRGGGTPSKARRDFWEGGTIPWVSSKDMDCFDLADTEDHISEEAIGGSATNLVPAKSVLVVVRSGVLRHTVPVAINLQPMAINQDIKAIVPHQGVSGWLVGRILSLCNTQLRDATVKVGTTVESIDIDALRSFEIPFPADADVTTVSGLFETMWAEQSVSVHRLSLLRRQKRGLMKKLLTGEWRVPTTGGSHAPGSLVTERLEAAE